MESLVGSYLGGALKSSGPCAKGHGQGLLVYKSFPYKSFPPVRLRP